MERLMRVTTVGDPIAPSRVCALLAKRGISARSIQMLRDKPTHGWTMQVLLEAESESGLDLATRQVANLIGVVSVEELADEGHNRRQSVFVTLEPTQGAAARVGEIARMFSAEVVELTSVFATLHLSAAPERCEDFLSVLEAYNVTHVDRSAVSGTVARTRVELLTTLDPTTRWEAP